MNYLERDIHRIAVSNSRLLSMNEARALLRYKDYRDYHYKVLSLGGEELVRRYLLHVLPKKLMRIRHFGFLSKRQRRCKFAQIQIALSMCPRNRMP